jgi:hypothetical protein
MPNGAWSNDQLNEIFVYDAQTGTLILRIDSTGFYYYNVSNGSYFSVGVGITNDSVASFWMPGASSIPGVTYEHAGEIIATEIVSVPGVTALPILNIFSPTTTGKLKSQISLAGQSNTSAVDDSQIEFIAALIISRNLNEIGQGTVDDGTVVSYTSANFTGTEIAADYVSERLGVFSTTRCYKMQWTGTVQSSTAGDRVGLRMYTGPNNNNLTGATQIFDYGQITIAAANIPQPFHVDAVFNGVPGKFGLLGARRVSGSGTCFLTINFRLCEDNTGAF